MDSDQPTHDREILDHDVAAERGAVGDDVTIAEEAIMGDVALHHQEILIAHPGHHAAGRGPWIERNILADRVAIADQKLARFALIFEIVRHGTDTREGKYHIAFAERGATGNDRVRVNSTAFADPHAGADDAIRTDLDITVDLGARIDNRRWVHPAHFTKRSQANSTSIAEISACATRLPST